MADVRYTAAAVQADIIAADHKDASRARETIRENLNRQLALVDDLWSKASPHGDDCGPRLISFPEFSLTAPPEEMSPEAFQNIAIEIPGELTDRIAESAITYGIFIAMNAYETDPEWPGRVFNTSFIVDPNGEVILKYRKLNSVQTGSLTYSQPGDFWQEYVEHYGGPEALFPVAQTEIGNLACFAAYDVRFAEVARCLALNGAEVLIFATGEPHGRVAWDESWEAAKRTRAWENQCYVIAPNSGVIHESNWPRFRQRGGSKIIDPQGDVIARVDGPGEASIDATVELQRLRQDRIDGVARNVIATSRFWIYLDMYADAELWPREMAADPPVEREDLALAIDRARTRAIKKGVFTPPETE